MADIAADLQNKKISTCLWFDTQAEAAAKFYVSVFKNSQLGAIARFTEAGHERHGKTAGSVMIVEFELEGRPFTALNGGPQFKFTEAISLVVHCDDQGEIDYFWDALTADGGHGGRCGWLKDRYGLSWQVVPSALPRLFAGAQGAKAERLMSAIMGMTKLEISVLERAAA